MSLPSSEGKSNEVTDGNRCLHVLNLDQSGKKILRLFISSSLLVHATISPSCLLLLHKIETTEPASTLLCRLGQYAIGQWSSEADAFYIQVEEVCVLNCYDHTIVVPLAAACFPVVVKPALSPEWTKMYSGSNSTIKLLRIINLILFTLKTKIKLKLLSSTPSYQSVGVTWVPWYEFCQ
jgi:hypothetical protein